MCDCDCDYDYDCDSVLETDSITSVLSDNSSDEILTTFDELIKSAEVLNNEIEVSFQALERIKEQINLHDKIMINNKDFGEILDELREKAFICIRENGKNTFGQMLISVL